MQAGIHFCWIVMLLVLAPNFILAQEDKTATVAPLQEPVVSATPEPAVALTAKNLDLAKKDAPEANNKPQEQNATPEQEIAGLQVSADSVAKAMAILAKNVTPQVAEAALAFLSKVGPGELSAVSALLELAYHPNAELQGKAKQLLLQTDTRWVASLRLLLRSNDKEISRKTALLLTELGKQEIPILLELLVSPNEAFRNIAQEALVSIGRDAVPALLAVMEKRPGDNALVGEILAIFKKLGPAGVPMLVTNIKNSKPEVRKVIVQALVFIDKPGLPAAISVLRLDQSKELKDVLQGICIQIGPSCIQEVLPLVSEPVPVVQNLAEETIKVWGGQTLPYLIEVLKGDNLEGRTNALRVLPSLGSDAAQAIQYVKPLLIERGILQLLALSAVKGMGDAAQEVIPELQNGFNSKDPWVRAESAYALANVGAKAKGMLPLFLDRLQSEEALVKIAICKAIGSMGTVATPAIPKLIAILQDEYSDESMIRAAAEALGGIGPDAKEAIAPLMTVFTYSYIGAKEREVAAIALSKIGKDVIPRLIYTLRFSEYREAREGAATALGYMKLSEKRIIEPLTTALKFDLQEMVRVAAAHALGNIQNIPSESIRALVETTKSETPLLREATSRALIKIGKSVVPYIMMELRRTDNSAFRAILVHVLGEIGMEAVESVPLLIGFFPRASLAERKEIIQSLGRMGNEAKKALPMFLEILRNDDDEELHSLLRITLVGFGSELTPQIIQLFQSDRDSTRQTATYILRQLGIPARSYMNQEIYPTQDEAVLLGLLNIIGEDPTALDTLLYTLTFGSEKVRETAVRLLSTMGSMPVPKLVERLKKSNRRTECLAIKDTLISIAAPAVAELIQLAQNVENKELHQLAVDAIAQIGPSADAAILPLLELMVTAKGEDQIYLAKALGKIGKSAIPQVVKLLDKEDKELRQSVIICLGETKSSEAIAYLLKALQNPGLLTLVIETVVHMKEISTPLLITSLQDKNHYVRFCCAAALLELKSPEAATALAAQLQQEKDPMVQYMIGLALGAVKK